MGKAFKLVLGAGTVAGLIGLPGLVRASDRRRETREGAGDRPSIMDGEEKQGVCSLDGTPLYVDYLGESDPTVFLVHGYTADGTEFRYQKPYLAEKYRVVSLDLRGHGRSEVPESRDFGMERLAEDLKVVVDAFEPERFVVAGHSMGGMATFKFYELFGKEYEGRLKGLAIIDSTGVDATGLSLRWGLFVRSNAKNLKENDLSRALMEKMRDSSFAYLVLRWLACGKRPPASAVEELQHMAFSTPVVTLKGAAQGGVRILPAERCSPRHAAGRQ